MPQAVAIFLLSPCKEKVLLIKRRDVPVFALPGGGVESNESAEEAAIREMGEETGLI
ncbi:MAG: NUDIX hydrolase, partial [Chlamydiae bacterium]|nr:NUDIX hydrolase [Chlamydiota bacterium]